MSAEKKKLFDRILAITLSILLIVSLMPTHLLASYAQENTADSLTFVVEDAEGNPVEEAEVTVSAEKINDAAPYTDTKNTDATGTVSFSEYVTSGNNGELADMSVTYTVKKAGYVDVSNTAELTSYAETISITLTALQTIPEEDYKIESFQGEYDGEEHGVSVEADGYTVEYSTDDVSYDKTSPTIKDVGEQKVYVRLSKDGYAAKVVEVILKVTKANRNDFVFETPSPADLVYVSDVSELSYKNAAESACEPGTVTYASDDNEIAEVDADGNVTFKKYGTVTITAEMEESRNYNSSTASYTISAKQKRADGFTFAFEKSEGSMTYGEQNNIFNNPATADPAEGTIKYSIKEQYRGNEEVDLTAEGEKGVAVIDEDTGDVTVLTAGKIVVEAEITDDVYETKSVEYTLTINKAEQTGFAFVENSAMQIAYGSSVTFIAEGGQSTGKVTYTVTEGADFVEVDKETGEVTAKAVCGENESVTITATKAGDNCYNQIPVDWTFTTVKAEQTNFAFADDTPTTVDYGTKTITVTADGGQSGEAIEYSITEGNTIAEIDSETGEITFKSEGIGTFKVQAVRRGGDNYIDAVDTHEITVVEAEFTDAYEMPEVPESGWYTSDIVIKAKENYLISTKNGFDADWGPSVTVDTEGLNEEYTFYLKEDKDDGKISRAIVLNEIKLDKTNPSVNGVVYSDAVTWIEKIIGFFNPKLEDEKPLIVTISTTDTVSGADHVVYKLSDDSNEMKAALDDNGNAIFTIDRECKGTLSFTVYDKAGNSFAVDCAEVLVNDITAPGIEVTFDNNNESENDTYYDASRTATIKITEENFYAEDVQIQVKAVNEKGTEFEIKSIQEKLKKLKKAENWKKKGNVYTAEIPFVDEADYTFSVAYRDKSGNEGTTVTNTFTIDKTNPEVSVAYDNNNVLNTDKFKAKRTATITIDEHNFDPKDVKVTVTAEDATGKKVATTDFATYLTKKENWTNKGNTHTAKITFSKDANYTFDIEYTDLAGRKDEDIDYGKSKATAKAFTIDTVNPTGSITIDKWEPWTGFTDRRSFGLWSKKTVKVSVASADELSGIDYVEHFRSDEILSLEQVKKSATWEKASLKKGAFSYNVKPNERFVVYVHIVDKAGNHRYLSSDGVIVDSTIPAFETLAPEVTVEPKKQPVNGIYNTDVLVDVSVTDPIKGKDVYSGLKSVTYNVYNMTNDEDEQVTQSGTLLSFDKKNPQKKDLVQKYEETAAIKIDRTKNNSNSVIVEVIAIDNAGNKTRKTCEVKIDVTNPTIDITYNNNDVDSTRYFKENRTASIVITERNFDADDVKVTITNTDGVIPEIGTWKKTSGDGNLDDTKWTTTVTYKADGDYTFDISYKDEAGNTADDPDYGDSAAPARFTIDKTRPTVSVSYDNNSAKNGKYFDAGRTATVVVEEHNFDEDRVDFIQTAELNGNRITIPSASWEHNEDVHTAKIVYTADGDYTFDVVVDDKAGNQSNDAEYGNSVAGKDFVVDKSIEKPDFGGVENGNAYKNDVIPTITLNDVNYDSYEIQLLRTRMGEIDVDVTNQFMRAISERSQGASGSYDTFEKIAENDGIYTLTVRVIDKAGNEETDEITFTVNRFGSVYEYSDYFASLIKDGGQYVTKTGKNKFAITEDLVITEYNADPLVADSLKILITRDGEAIDVDYTASPAQGGVGGSGWYEYVYNIAASNFAEDGVYKMTLTSAYATSDSESNESSSMPDNSVDEDGNQIVDAMTFTVDTTAPELRNVVNLDEAIVNADKLEVSYNFVDVGGLKSVEIFLGGKSIDKITEFDDNNFNYSGKFTIPTGSRQSVRLIATDMAGNVTDTASKDFETGGLYVFNDTVTVSTNFFVRWYANKLLFWGTVLGVIVLAGVGGYTISSKRKKDEE